MEDQLYTFDPGTLTSKCPMPTVFTHLLGSIPRIEQYISLHNQEDIVNINNQLNQTMNLMVSNIIQRVIAQIIGKTDNGFVTIKGTDDGELHIHAPGIGAIDDAIVAAGAEGSLSAKLRRTTQGLEDLKAGITCLITGNVNIIGTSQTLEKAEIDFSGGGDSTIITGTASKQTKVTSLVFTVADETDITLIDGSTDISGPMDFGGSNEPRGIVIPHGIMYLPCGTANDFKINSSAAVQVSGYAVFYKETV